MAERVDVLAARWVAELSVSPNGLHEIRAGAVNERERPLVGYATTYEIANGIADEHNRSAAVAELIEVVNDAVTSSSMSAQTRASLSAALARVGGAS